jgi:hypothetical protein
VVGDGPNEPVGEWKGNPTADKGLNWLPGALVTAGKLSRRGGRGVRLGAPGSSFPLTMVGG